MKDVSDNNRIDHQEVANQDDAVHLRERDGSRGRLPAVPHRPVRHHRQLRLGHQRVNGGYKPDPPGQPVLRHLHQEDAQLLLDLLHASHHLLNDRHFFILWPRRRQ